MTGPNSDMTGHEPDMDAFEAFRDCLGETLAHLYDPAYRPPDIVWAVTGCDPQQGPEMIQAALIQAIEELRPAPYVPPTARSRRIYGLLSYRYVQDLTQEETAERLGITPRHLRREQPEAVHTLALRMWSQSGGEAPSTEELAETEAAQPLEAVAQSAKPPSYRSQVRQELEALQQSAPGAVADVGETLRSTAELGSTLTAGRGVNLKVEWVQPNLVAGIHSTVLRQVLLSAIGQLAQLMSSGQITIRAERQDRNVKVAITGRPATADNLHNTGFIHEILGTQGGSIETVTEGDQVTFYIALPSADVDVLVVDDNADLIHLYRRYVVGTRYRIVHAEKGQRVFEIIENSVPDLIVLDVMLPDIDGWELLARLHEHPVARAIPIIVCSVVREQDLALALGAALYLLKPVERQQFIQALNQVLSRVAARARLSPTNNAAAC